MAERRVTNIMTQWDRFDEIFVEPEKTPNGPGYFWNKLNVENPVGNVVIFYEVEYLSFIDITGIGFWVENPIGV